VTFYDGVTVLGVGTISGTQATLTTVMLPSGTRQLRAYYGGDATYAASSSALLPQTVVAGSSLRFRREVSYALVRKFIRWRWVTSTETPNRTS